MKVIDFEVLVSALAAAWVIMRVIDAVIKPIWGKLEWDPFYLQYVAIGLGGPLGWATGMDMLPGFSVVWPLVGRLMTCLVMALGPSFIYDLVDKQPEPPA